MLVTPRPPRSTLFPDTTLFRSEHLQHLLDFLELLQQLVDIGGGHPAAVGDPQAAGTVDHLRLATLVGGHGADDGFDAGDLRIDRKSTRLNSSHANISYAVFCLT